MAKGKRKKKTFSGTTVMLTVQHSGTPEVVSTPSTSACTTCLDDTNEWPALERLKTVLQVVWAKYFPAPEPVQVDLSEPKQVQVLVGDNPSAPEFAPVDLCEPTQVQELPAVQPPVSELVQVDLSEPKQVQFRYLRKTMPQHLNLHKLTCVKKFRNFPQSSLQYLNLYRWTFVIQYKFRYFQKTISQNLNLSR
ncbi:hypothetical protein WMY93_003803 [Mugilogobius chulae]|uniref:Uncharacterized protein n=1 Tax=Mugilogobius chulae TaxID=88201 RepID=A0AAW0Q7L3_9GOBI